MLTILRLRFLCALLLLSSVAFGAVNTAGNINPCLSATMEIGPIPQPVFVGGPQLVSATVSSPVNIAGTFTWRLGAVGVAQITIPGVTCPPRRGLPVTLTTSGSKDQNNVWHSEILVWGLREGLTPLYVDWKSADGQYCGSKNWPVAVVNRNRQQGRSLPVGGKYRRVDVHGVPQPDPSPTGEGEEDRLPNMASTDMYAKVKDMCKSKRHACT